MLAGTVAGAGAGFAVGIFDAIWNANCITEGLQIIAFDTATGAISGFLASGGGWLGAILGESGGIGLNIINGFNAAVPSKSPCNPEPEDELCK